MRDFSDNNRLLVKMIDVCLQPVEAFSVRFGPNWQAYGTHQSFPVKAMDKGSPQCRNGYNLTYLPVNRYRQATGNQRNSKPKKGATERTAEIRRCYFQENKSQTELAQSTGLAPPTIRNITHRKAGQQCPHGGQILYCENVRLAGLYVYSQHQHFYPLRRPLNQHLLLRTPPMKQMMILGIANTGLAVVKLKLFGYSLIAAETMTLPNW